MERAYDAVVVGSGFGGGIAACRLADDGGPGAWGHAFGALPSGVDTAAIVSRATPRLAG